MSRISGYFQYHPILNKEQIAILIKTMNDLVVLRGPDDEGTYIDNNIGMGLRRLANIDLITGSQLIFNENETLVIIMNGEIYNYRSLKQDLLAKGHVFKTQSNSEVVLHCFEEYGYDCFDKLKGMFVFTIYDLNRKKIIIARDRAGEKPLYYYQDSNVFLFASELKSIISTGFVNKSIDKKALNQFFRLTYIPAPLTIFKDVYKLLPGHYMVVDENKCLNIEQYWDVKYRDDCIINDYDQCKTRLRKALFNAVEECIAYNTEVGTFLSGGIDSTIINGIASKLSDKKIDSFTIGYIDKQFDESARAKLSAKLHKSNHHVFYLKYEDALPELEVIFSSMDEPFADSSIIPTYLVSKLASEHIKMVLTGDAGDQLFGGSNKYLIDHYSSKYKRIPKWVRDNLIAKVVYAMPDKTGFTRKARKVIENYDKTISEQRISLMCLGFNQVELSYLLNDNWIDISNTEFISGHYYKHMQIEDELSRAFYTDLKVVVEGDLLAKVCKAGALSSLDTRIPMLGKDVIELAAMIPNKYKINSKTSKIILKDTFRDLIPDDLMKAKKSGFAVPIAKWLQEDLKADLQEELSLNKIQEQGLFNYEYIKIILDEHFSWKNNRYSELWALFVFQKWYDKHFVNAIL